MVEIGHFALVLAFALSLVQAAVPLVESSTGSDWVARLQVTSPNTTSRLQCSLMSTPAILPMLNSPPTMGSPSHTRLVQSQAVGKGSGRQDCRWGATPVAGGCVTEWDEGGEMFHGADRSRTKVRPLPLPHVASRTDPRDVAAAFRACLAARRAGEAPPGR